MLPLRPALRLSLLATALVAANLAHAEVPAGAPFTPEQQLVLEKYRSGLADKAEDVVSKLDKLEARLQSKQDYDKDVLALGQKNIDWMLAFMGLTLAAAAFLGWRTKARIESEWIEQKQQMDKAHQQAVTDTDKAREALTQEVGRSLDEARERLRELREELKHARSMNTEIRQVRDSAVTPRADAPAAEIEAAQKENEANAEHSPQSKLAALAQKFDQEGNWQEAVPRWLALTDLELENADYWFNYGYALNQWMKQCKEPAQIHYLASLAQAVWQKVVALRPTDAAAYTNWGNVFFSLAKAETGNLQQQHLTNACSKYAEATRHGGTLAVAYSNWGQALFGLAIRETGVARQQYLIDACSKFEEVTRLQPDDAAVFDAWGVALLHLADTLSGVELEAKLQEAESKLLHAKVLGHSNPFNLACLRARQKRPDESCELLQQTREAGHLPNYAHLSTDKDLDNLRELDWFKRLLEEIRQQEEVQAAQPA